MENKAVAELTLTRVISAPRELVFKAWTEAEHLAKWWGPKGFTNPLCQTDVRPGGAIRIDMKSPDGTVMPMGGYFKEIKAPDRVIFVTTAFEDENGEHMIENLISVAFTEENNKTILTLNVKVVKAAPGLSVFLAMLGPEWGSSLEQGWNQNLDRLEALWDKANF
jgi:uncharacterized protein YndB with AHSA1/START domain